MTVFQLFLAVHIAAGFIALVVPPFAMITAKGGLWHRRWGKIYFWAMAGVAVTATVLCWLRSGLFLFLISILSSYLALSGYRVLSRKQPGSGARAADIIAASLVLIAGGFMMVKGLQDDGTRRWLSLIFGAFAMLLGANDLVSFLRPVVAKQTWMLDHMTRFLFAYVATVTAFSAVNFQFMPMFWRWLWPTFFGTAAIVLWRGKIKKQINHKNYGIVL